MLPKPPTLERAGFRVISLTSLIIFGVSVTEAVSVNLLPLTLYLFTENAFYIALILAINPIFGFIAQPLVGVLSDRTWTRVGRRAFYLILAAPITAVSLIFIPFSTALWQIVILVIIVQFFEDFHYGVNKSLLIELVPPEQRSFVAGINSAFARLAAIAVLFMGMRWVTVYKETHGDTHYGLPLYFAAAACQIVFIMFFAFFLREKRYDSLSERPRLTPRQYVRDFVEQPMLLKLGSVLFVRAYQRAAINGFIGLYAINNLLFTEAQFGSSWGWMPFIALTLAVPIGVGVEWFNKQRALIFAFATMVAVSAAGYSASIPILLLTAAVCFGVGDMILDLAHKTLVTDFYPQGMIGQLSTTMNIFYAMGRTIGLISVGWLVKSFGNDYSVIWPISGISAVVGIIVLLSVRDIRYEERKKVRNAARSDD